MKIRVLSSAFNDLAKGREFYERQGQDLGGYFLDSLFSDIDSLALYAGTHRKISGFHRLLSKRFPYAIYYQLEMGDDAVVYRVLDCQQRPDKIRAALKSAGD